MHKFQPRVHLVLFWKPNKYLVDLDKEEHKTFVFPETTFTAVTAYQNQLVRHIKQILVKLDLSACYFLPDHQIEDRQQPICKGIPGFSSVGGI